MGTPAPKAGLTKKSNVMLQATKNKYTLETLLPLNVSYDYDHQLTQPDVDMANALVELIECTRTDEYPQAGDLMVHVSRHGDYSARALIEKEHDGTLSVCIHPSIPFVYRKDNGIGCDVSGDPFDRVKIPDVKFKGWDTAYFKEWGHCGPRANGSVSFAARVALWEYRKPDPIYGDFTTKDWQKIYVRKDTDGDAEYLYQGIGICCKNEAEFEEFLRDHEGTAFPGNWNNQIVVWCFKHSVKGISREQWEAMDIPVSERVVHGRMQPVKICKDMGNHESVFFYLSPETTNIPTNLQK